MRQEKKFRADGAGFRESGLAINLGVAGGWDRSPRSQERDRGAFHSSRAIISENQVVRAIFIRTGKEQKHILRLRLPQSRIIVTGGPSTRRSG